MSKRLAQALAGKLEDMVQVLTDDQLRGVLADCSWCSETNCGWLEYRLSSIVYAAADNEIDRRQIATRDPANNLKGG